LADPYADSPEFERLARGEGAVDLARIALECARDADPDVDIPAALGQLDAYARRAADRRPKLGGDRTLLHQINWVLFVEEGFRGNREDYYEAENSYLDRVIDRRRGIPITLSLIYLAVADRLGLPMAGVNLPGHFVIRTVGPGEPIIVDPFHEGRFLDRSQCVELAAQQAGRTLALADADFEPCAPQTLIARLLRNLKAIFWAREDMAACRPVLERLARLSDAPADRRDLGLACLATERPGRAFDLFADYLARCPDAEDAETIRALRVRAWREVGESN